MVDIKNYTDDPTKEYEFQNADRNRKVKEHCSVHMFSDVYILPGAGILEEGLFGEVVDHMGTVIQGVNSHTVYPLKQTARLPDIYANIDKCIFFGSTPTGWGHYITDGLSKLWYLNTDQCKNYIEQGYQCVMVGVYGNPNLVPDSFASLISLLGVDPNSIRFVDGVTKVHEIIIPESSIFIGEHGRQYTQEYESTIQTIIDSVPEKKLPKKFEKLYLSRRHFKNKHSEFGEKHIEKAFKRVGFNVVYPEELSVDTQINLYRQATHIVSTEGSISHNMIFCSKGSKVDILRKAFYTNDYQYMINNVRNLDVTYVDVHLTVFSTDQPNMGPFYIYINDNVVQYFKDRYKVVIKNNFNAITFANYIRICMKSTDFYVRMSNPLPEYYYKKMTNEIRNGKFFYAVKYLRTLFHV